MKGRKVCLIDRIRSGSEAAPWVVEEVRHLCAEIERLREEAEDSGTRYRNLESRAVHAIRRYGHSDHCAADHLYGSGRCRGADNDCSWQDATADLAGLDACREKVVTAGTKGWETIPCGHGSRVERLEGVGGVAVAKSSGAWWLKTEGGLLEGHADSLEAAKAAVVECAARYLWMKEVVG